MFDEPENGPEVQAWLRERAAPTPVASRFEVLDGEQVAVPADSEAHAACLDRLNRLLTDAAGASAIVSLQSPVRLSEASQPCPDLALLLPREGGFSTGLPDPREVLLLVDVADSSSRLSHDRGRKAASYARGGVPECWVVDLLSAQILVHRSPASGGYRDIRQYRAEGTIGVRALPGVYVAAGDVLGDH